MKNPSTTPSPTEPSKEPSPSPSPRGTSTPLPTPTPKAPADYLAELEARPAYDPVVVPAQYEQKFRQQYHFSPVRGWIGDPDGTIRYNGTYHLFWWGHAESEDLVHWKERPFPSVNLPGIDSGSGSVIVDVRNDSGFAIPGQNPPMLAFFTIFDADGTGHQAPGLAVSYDYTRFGYYDQNPLIIHEEKGFRDPHVFYHEETGQYIMAIAIADRRMIGFYGSKDLKNWEHLSDFGPVGAQSQVWECPDLFQMAIDGDPNNRKWVMLVGMGPNTEQYFVGDFDGEKFTLDADASAYLLRGDGLHGTVFADFENGLPEGWSAEGDPLMVGNGDALGSHASAGFLGSGYLSTFTPGSENGHRGQVTITSPKFTIELPYINFLLAGSARGAEAGVQLLVDGEAVRTANGDDTNILRWVSWDVSQWVGKQAQIEIIDQRTGAIGGHISVDHFMFSSSPALAGREHANWLDFGPDYYAVRSYNDYDDPNSPKIIIAWLGNWEYATTVPTDWGRGSQALPREITLVQRDGGLRIVQRPIPALEGLRKDPVLISGRVIEDTAPLVEFQPPRNTYELDLTFQITDPAAKFGVRTAVNGSYGVTVGYDVASSIVFLDRTIPENGGFNARFAKYSAAPLQPQDGKIRLRIFVDQSSIEVFANDGEVTLSALMLPEPDSLGIELFSENGAVQLLDLSAWELESIWSVEAK